MSRLTPSYWWNYFQPQLKASFQKTINEPNFLKREIQITDFKFEISDMKCVEDRPFSFFLEAKASQYHDHVINVKRSKFMMYLK